MVPTKSPPSVHVKVSLHSIDEGPPMVIWVGLVCSYHKSLVAFLTSSGNRCFYNDRLKLWIMDFLLLESLAAFLATQIPDSKLEELPRFLMQGLKSYLTRVNGIPKPIELNIEPKLAEVSVVINT
jgi:hypothetical protein